MAWQCLVIGFDHLFRFDVFRRTANVHRSDPSVDVSGFANMGICASLFTSMLIYHAQRVPRRRGRLLFCLIIPFYLLFTFGSVLEYTNFRQLLPVLDHPLPSILKAAKEMTLTMLGYETILLFYPFLKNGQQSSKWGHAALLSTTLFYTLLTVLTLAYFSEKQLQRQVWATLTMWKMVEMPFIERFEYIGIANWLLVILPNVCLGLWCSSRLCTHIFPIQQKYALLVITCICFAAIIAVQDRTGVNTINEVISKVGFYFLYAWIPFLAILTYVRTKRRDAQ